MLESDDENDTDTPQEIILLNSAYAALAEACSVEEVRDVRDRAEAVRAYARKARLGRDILVEAAALRLRSERRLGQLLQTLPLAKAAPGNQYSHAEPADVSPSQIRLQDIGITKSDSSRLQRIAKVPEERFQAYLQDSIEAHRECSTAACLRLTKTNKARPSRSSAEKPPPSPAMESFIRSKRHFTTIYADPFRNGPELAADSPAQVNALCAEPVCELCEENAHLHFMTPASRLPDALEVMAVWTFEYVFCVPWPAFDDSETISLQESHDLLLVGRRGKLPFGSLSLSAWLQFTEQGRSQQALVDLIQQVSPGLYLDVTSNNVPVNPDWTTVIEGILS